MAVQVRTKKGGLFTLLNPSEKARKYADELGNGVKQTNDGMIKFGNDGQPERLSVAEKFFRSGYLQAREDSAKAYKAKQRRK